MRDITKPTTRRAFLKTGLTLAVTGLLLPWQRAALGDPTPKMVSEAEPLAKTIGYVANAAKSPKRADKTQSCKNCMFYTPGGAKKGKCQIFQNNYVAAGGWCSSWAKKP